MQDQMLFPVQYKNSNNHTVLKSGNFNTSNTQERTSRYIPNVGRKPRVRRLLQGQGILDSNEKNMIKLV